MKSLLVFALFLSINSYAKDADQKPSETKTPAAKAEEVKKEDGSRNEKVQTLVPIIFAPGSTETRLFSIAVDNTGRPARFNYLRAVTANQKKDDHGSTNFISCTIYHPEFVMGMMIKTGELFELLTHTDVDKRKVTTREIAQDVSIAAGAPFTEAQLDSLKTIEDVRSHLANLGAQIPTNGDPMETDVYMVVFKLKSTTGNIYDMNCKSENVQLTAAQYFGFLRGTVFEVIPNVP